jgi:uncharacterized membrane protein YozB (DUF420 family)
MPTGPQIILTLKVLVTVVTVLLAVALWAIATGRKRLHGRINRVFFVLTLTTVVGFELLLRVGTDVSASFSDAARQALRVHLWFAVPSALVLPVMLLSGVRHWRTLHLTCGVLFLVLWIGTFVTGVFFLPHDG